MSPTLIAMRLVRPSGEEAARGPLAADLIAEAERKVGAPWATLRARGWRLEPVSPVCAAEGCDGIPCYGFSDPTRRDAPALRTCREHRPLGEAYLASLAPPELRAREDGTASRESSGTRETRSQVKCSAAAPALCGEAPQAPVQGELL